MVVLFLVFWETSIQFSTVAASIYFPTNSVQVFPFLQSLLTFVICVLFDDSHSDMSEVISHCGFFLKYLYWSIIALQWCVSFCFITKWISYTYTYIPISPPSFVSHCDFNLHISDDSWCRVSFHVSVGHMHFLFGKMSVQFFWTFLTAHF